MKFEPYQMEDFIKLFKKFHFNLTICNENFKKITSKHICATHKKGI